MKKYNKYGKDSYNHIRARNMFNLSYYNITELKPGYIIPIALYETIPGDVFYGKTQGMVRFAPMVTVPMTQYHLETHTFFVPTHMIWDEFKDFITRGDDGKARPEMPWRDDSASMFTKWDETIQDYIRTSDGAQLSNRLDPYFYNNTIANDFDITTGELKEGKTINTNKKINALPYRVYTTIWNHYYRDQQLQDLAPVGMLSGRDESNVMLLKANWDKDRYTTLRPNPQLGEAVSVPVVGTANLNNIINQIVTDGKSVKWNHPTSQPDKAYMSATSTGGVVINESPWNNTPLHYANEGLQVNQTGEGTISGLQFNIDTFLKAEHLQKLLRIKNSYGNQYVDTLRYMGIVVNDLEIDRPVLLNMTKKTVSFSEILQTAYTPVAPEGVGTIYGHGVGGIQTNGFVYHCSHYGYIMTVAILRPVPMYANQLPQEMKVRTVDEIYDPIFEYEGDEPVDKYEVYNTCTVLDSDPTNNQPLANGGVFGWETKFNRYKTKPNQITGRMAYDPQQLKWHGGREFSDAPQLNSSFVSCNPTNRFFANKNINQYNNQGYFLNVFKVLRQIKKHSGIGIY